MNIDNVLDELINTLLIIRSINYELHDGSSDFYEIYEHISYIFKSYDKMYYPDKMFLTDILSTMKSNDPIKESSSSKSNDPIKESSSSKFDDSIKEEKQNFADNEWMFKCIRYSLKKNDVLYKEELLSSIRIR